MNMLAVIGQEQDMLPLRAWLIRLTEPTVAVIDMLALILIVIATAIAFVKVIRLLVTKSTNVQRRDIWLDYGRWLVAALTFQLAADIIESSIYTTWDAIGQLAAIAVVRTFLNYFLERDMEEIRERQHRRHAEPE